MFFKKKKSNNKNFFKQLAGKERKVFDIIKQFPGGFIFLNERKKIIFINPVAENLLEVKLNDVLEKSPLYLNHFPKIKPLVPYISQKPEKSFQKEIKVNPGFFLSISVVPIYSKKKFLGTMVALKNISQEKFLEKAKIDFVTLAAHQFRTPISVVKWAVSMISEKQDNLTSEQKQLIEKIEKVNEKMIFLINTLLDFAKIEKNQESFKQELFQIEDLILELARKHETRMKKKKIKLVFQSPSQNLPKIMVNEFKIKIAIENILDNAIRYNKKGGKINISFEQREKNIVIFIEDTGVGIPSNQQYKVFSYFFRGSNILQLHTEGIGLGVYISKQIIEKHEGRIWFESKENQGTTFTISLPIKKKFQETITKDFY